jgi:F0F1-type ATP synthase assembly protein I
VDQESKRGIARAGTVGIEIGVAVIVCLLVGSWADGKLGTTPWLTLLGIVLGTVVGLKAVLRAAKETESTTENDR